MIGNEAPTGGGIYSGKGTVYLQTGSTVADNRATGAGADGGGITVAGGATLDISGGSTVENNNAGGDGGGIYFMCLRGRFSAYFKPC